MTTYQLIIEKAEEGGYIGYVPEIPGANSQGETIEELRDNMREAIKMIVEVRREEARKNFKSDSILEEISV